MEKNTKGVGKVKESPKVIVEQKNGVHIEFSGYVNALGMIVDAFALGVDVRILPPKKTKKKQKVIN